MNWRSRIIGHESVDPRELKANPKNHRLHPQSQRDAVRDSISELGFVKSVLVNKTTGYVVDGHQRLWQALIEIETDPSVLIDVEYVELSEAEEAKALAVLDASTDMAEIDPVKLEELLREFETDSEALEKMLSDLADPILEDIQVEDVEPEIDAADVLMHVWGTAEGQLWIIEGKQTHRLLCGDSTKADDVGRLMDGETADLIFTSPPYGQQRDYDKESAVDCSDWDKLMNGVFGNLPANEKTQVLVNLGLIHRECEWIPYWENWIEFMRSDGWRVDFGWYVWDQGAGLPGDSNGRPGRSFEFVFHFNRQSDRPIKWVETKTESQNSKSSTVGFRKEGGSQECYSPHLIGQTHKVPDSVIRVPRNSTMGSFHSATFAIGLPEYIIKCWSGLCYEPFSGSGTTMLAAEQLNRKCYGMEISPKYCAVILQRMKTAGCKCRIEK